MDNAEKLIPNIPILEEVNNMENTIVSINVTTPKIKTMRYLGNKTELLEFINSTI